VRRFQFLRPSTLEDLLELLEEFGPDACLLAGGTDLIVRLRMGHTRPGAVIDMKKIAELRGGIADTAGGLRISALTTMRALTRDERVRRHFPALAESASVVGSVQIRNRATLAGNICNASPAADTAPALLVYGAAVNVVGRGGCHSVPLDRFFTGPGKTLLRRGEIVESIDLPYPAERHGAAFDRITRRRGVDLATINVCCGVDETGRVRLAYGALGPRPFLVEVKDQAAAWETAAAHASPISDVRGSRDYRLAMMQVLTRRVVQRAIERGCNTGFSRSSGERSSP
jgi:carbon-monoxide dehydrogenase medium subunit